MGLSVGVGRVDVFGQRLLIVTTLAERLPVVLIPEKFLITTVWNDVIHNRCPDVLALLGTLHTERMSFQIRLSDFLPPPVVSTLRCRAGHLWMERQVLLTVEPAGFHQLWAAGVMARCLWSVWHGSVLPRKTSLTEVTVSTDLVVIYIQQSQSLDDTLRSQVVAVMDIGLDELDVLMLRAKALNRHTHRLNHTDSVGQLDFALVSVARLHDVLGNLSRHVCCGAIHFGGVFPAQSAAAHTTDTAVGIARQLPPRHTTVSVTAAQHETAGRIDQLREVTVQTVLASGEHHHGFDDVPEVADLHIRAMLHGTEEGGDTTGVVIVADLCLGICTEHLRRMVLQQLQKLGSGGAGVAFKLCAALEGCDPAELLEMYGELAALGTVADVMPLVGENRTIVREGLSLLQDTMRPGLHALLESAGCGGKPVTADTVSYSLAPRLNAAGRMDNAAVALKLLLCGDEDQATGIAERLAEINTERQQTEQQVFAAALQALEADPARTRDRVLVVSGEDWHPGVIGIVAARLMERFSRPVIVISMHEGEGRGSGRAPDPFDLHSALADCAQYLTRFGGHAAAAGVEIEEENLAAFRQTINAWAAAHAAPPEAVSLRLDAAATLGELNLENVGELARLAPFGRENPTPVLLVQHAFVDGIWPMGAEGRHTRIRLRQGSDTLFASSFGIAPQAFAYPVGSEVEAALEVSIFNGRSGPMVSAHLKAIRPAELGNTPSEQAAWFEAFRTGGSLDAARATALLPARADTVSLYRRIRGGHVAAADLQPVFAAEGPQNTGKTLASLTALQELGLIEEQEGRWLPVPVTAKQDLASAPVLQKLAELAKQA